MKEQISEELFEAQLEDIEKAINVLGDFFASPGFQQSTYFSEKQKGTLQPMLKGLQDALRDELTERAEKHRKKEPLTFIDASNLNNVIRETGELINKVIKPLSQGKDLKGKPIESSEDSIKQLAKEIKKRVDHYENKVVKVSSGERFAVKISDFVKAIKRTALSGLATLAGRTLDETPKTGNVHRYPIKNAASFFASVAGRMPEKLPELEGTGLRESSKSTESICVIGPEKSGKTALLIQLLRPEVFIEDYEATVVDSYRVSSPSGQNKKITDIGGNEEFKDIGKEDMESADTIFITLGAEMLQNSDEAMDTLRGYKNWAEELAPEAAIQLVITKMDLIDEGDREVFEGKVNNIAKEVGINTDSVTYTSAKEKNINAFKEVILAEEQVAQRMTPSNR